LWRRHLRPAGSLSAVSWESPLAATVAALQERNAQFGARFQNAFKLIERHLRRPTVLVSSTTALV
jgi:hypothetical protein